MIDKEPTVTHVVEELEFPCFEDVQQPEDMAMEQPIILNERDRHQPIWLRDDDTTS